MITKWNALAYCGAKSQWQSALQLKADKKSEKNMNIYGKEEMTNAVDTAENEYKYIQVYFFQNN